MGAVERFLDARQKVGVFCAGLAALGVGVVLYLGPEDVPEKLPQHRVVGVAAVGFGVLVLAVLFLGSSPAGRRLRGLLLAVSMGALAVLCGLGVGPPAWDAWRLAKDGRPAQAEVLRADRVLKGKQFKTRLLVTYDGHRATLEASGRPGDRIAVLYLREDPTVVAPGREGESFLDLAQRSVGGAWLWIGALLTVSGALAALVGLRDFLLGPPSAPAGGREQREN